MARPSYSAKDAIRLFERQGDTARPLYKGDLEDELEWSGGTVHNKLNQLVEEGELATRTLGEYEGATRVWWIPHEQEEGDDRIHPPETVEDVLDLVRLDIPGPSEEVVQERATAIHSAYQFLKKEGSATPEQLQDRAEESIDGFDTELWWNTWFSDILRTLPNVDYPPSFGEWHYVDPESELAEELNVDLDPDVAELEFNVDGDAAEYRRALVQIAYNFLKEESPIMKNRFEWVMPEYTAHYSNFDTMWVQLIRPKLESLPGTRPPEKGVKVWEYIEPGSNDDVLIEGTEIDDWLADMDIRGSGSVADDRRVLIQICYNFLKEEKTAKRDDFREVLPDYFAFFSDFDNLWSLCISPVLQKGPGIDYSEGYTWKYVE